MVPTITLGGSSFKGASLYYLHDKRQPGETARFTSARIGWIVTNNLPTDDPERGWKIMAHTALAAECTLSKLWSMAFVWQAFRQQDPQADALTIFYTLMSSGRRRAVFEAAQEGERRDMARQIKREIGAAGRAIDRDAGHQYDSLRVGFLKKCGDLRQRQQTEKALRVARAFFRGKTRIEVG